MSLLNQIDYLNRSRFLKKKGKEEIKVLIITTQYPLNEHAYKNIDVNGKITYTGFLYDIFKIIKRNLSKKYSFKKYFKDFTNYDNEVLNVYNNKYDLIVGGFYTTSWRQKYVNFTIPIYLNANGILHIKKKNRLQDIFKLIFNVVKPIILLLFLGIIFGIILYFIEPKRNYLLPNIKNKSHSLKRTILSVIAAFFGEMGFLSENSQLTIPGIISIVLIIIIAFSLLIITQAKITTLNINLSKSHKIDMSNLNKYKFLGHKGDAAAQSIQQAGGHIQYIDKLIKNNSHENILKFYLKNTDKYDGIAMAWTEAYAQKKGRDNLEISYEDEDINENLGLKPSVWIVNKNKQELLKDLNDQILKLQDTHITRLYCKKYIKNSLLCI